MAIFSTNQNRHFYLVTEATSEGAPVEQTDDAGTYRIYTVGDECDKEVIIEVKGADTVIKSDRIPVKNISYVKKLAASDMLVPLKKIEVELASTPIAGEDYVLRIAFRQFYGMSDQDQYFKDAVVHATSAIDNAKKLFDKMVESLNLAFSREVGASKTSNPYLKFEVSGSDSSAKLVITEKAQDWAWSLGTDAQERVYFDVIPTTIYDGSDDVIWAKEQAGGKYYIDATPTTSLVAGTNAIGNGKKIAELEYFCMGERGDQYRNIGWPNVIPTKYLVDDSEEYDVMEIHFAFTDTGVNSYRSEKDITIVSSESGVIDALYSEFMTAAGLSTGESASDDSGDDSGNG